MAWAAFSPDGKLLLIANNGALTLRDAATGAPLGTPDGRVPLAMKATHPDWSPDGRYVAVALSNAAITNMDVRNSAIARIPFQDGAFSAPEILVRPGMMSNNYFPRWSPDGAFIAYVNAKTSPLGAKSAELRLVRAPSLRYSNIPFFSFCLLYSVFCLLVTCHSSLVTRFPS